jgi:tetratricopeptide (TPR) repeat protein
MQLPSPIDADYTIRVFISSTFRDMMRERDLLVKQVFPELRRKCASRFITLTEVDLRWGITEDQANEGQVLPLCLAEIERSRPYFIGLLGERYGWIPDTIRPEVVRREPWLQEHLRDRTSVTELEILHGVLNNPEMRANAFFYFRDPAYAADPGLTAAEQWDLVEHDIPADVQSHGSAEAARRTGERKAKLAALKQRIRDSKLPLVESYPNPQALAEIVRGQFDELIDRLHPQHQTPDPLARERIAHEAHAKNKLFACIPRPLHLSELNTWAEPAAHDGKGLVLTGDSGSGKTALLAAWTRDWARTHPQDFVFQHYFGATPESASPTGFLRRLLGELQARFAIADGIPAGPDKLREVLPVWLAQTSGKGRIVLVLDGLNQVQGGEPDLRLLFLPKDFPSHVTALASALPGPALDALRGRAWPEHHLPLASEQEVDAMVGAYLTVYARTLELGLHRQLVTAPGARNPLFLRTVLEELRLFGSFEQLPERVRHYLEVDNPKDLFLRVIRRWQEDFDGTGAENLNLNPDLVCRALSLLWAARQGLSEPEWLDLLGASVEPTSSIVPPADPIRAQSPLPRAHWTPLFLAMEPHLSQRAGLLSFAHDFLRQAVEVAFLASDSQRHAAHLAIAGYFESSVGQWEITPRQAAEWPYQLHAAQAWDRLESCLTSFPLFRTLYTDNTKWELSSYWNPLRSVGRDMGLCYRNAWNRRFANAPVSITSADLAYDLGTFLDDNACFVEAEYLLRYTLDAREHLLGPQHANTTICMNNLARLRGHLGDYAEAERLYRRSLQAIEIALGSDHRETIAVMTNLAWMLSCRGKLAESEALYHRAHEAFRRVLGPEHPNTLLCQSNLAGVLQDLGNLAEAQALYEDALENETRLLGPHHPSTLATINSMATLMYEQGDYARAESLCRRALQASETVRGPDHPETLVILNNLGGFRATRGDYAEAEELSSRALAGFEAVLGPDHPFTLTSVDCLASAKRENGDKAAAERLFRRALESRTRVLGPDHAQTLVSMSNLAALLDNKGDASEAQALCLSALRVRERTLGRDHPDTLDSVNNLACFYGNRANYAQSEPLHRRAWEGRQKALGPHHPHALASLENLATLMQEKKDFQSAEPLFRQLVETREQVLGPLHPDTLAAAKKLAILLSQAGDKDGSDSIARRVLAAEHPDVLANSKNPIMDLLMGELASLLTKVPDGTQIEAGGATFVVERNSVAPDHVETARQAVANCEREFGAEHANTIAALNLLARQLEAKEAFDEAEIEYRRAFDRAPSNMVVLGNYAFFLQNARHDPAGARDFYLRALHADPTDFINRTNFAGFCLSLGEARDAEDQLHQAWRLAPAKPDRFVARALFLRAALAAVRQESAALYLGQLRTLFEQGIEPAQSRNTTVRDYLLLHLPPAESALFDSIYNAINQPDGIAALAVLPTWQSIQPQSLDTPWPGPAETV